MSFGRGICFENVILQAASGYSPSHEHSIREIPMDPMPYSVAPRPASRMPMLIGVLIALVLLCGLQFYLPDYLERVEYAKMAGRFGRSTRFCPKSGRSSNR